MSEQRRRQILLINPNSNATTTEMMRAFAQAELPGDEVHGATARGGPRMITEPNALRAARKYVVAEALKALEAGPVDAIIVAAIGDPGRAELADLLDIPVIGIGQASVIAASAAGQPFGMATSTPDLAASLGVLAATHGAGAPFTGVELTVSEPLELAADPERQFAELRTCVQASAARGATAVIIAGGPLSDTARRLRDLGIVRVIEPIPAACELLAQVG